MRKNNIDSLYFNLKELNTQKYEIHQKNKRHRNKRSKSDTSRAFRKHLIYNKESTYKHHVIRNIRISIIKRLFIETTCHDVRFDQINYYDGPDKKKLFVKECCCRKKI